MESVDDLARTIIKLAKGMPEGRRFVVGVAGIPGSGKSTIAYSLVERLNEILPTSHRDSEALCIGVDGWHFSQETLRSMPNSKTLFDRRGAHFTFDADGFTSFVHSLDSNASQPIAFPTFSHADKDPIPNGGEVLPRHRIIVIEGLYCFLDIPAWRSAALRMDERIWVHADRNDARARLTLRHFQEGVEATMEAAARRADQSDMLNADFILENSLKPTLVIDNGEIGSLEIPVDVSLGVEHREMVRV